jgi:hypothetical protein
MAPAVELEITPSSCSWTSSWPTKAWALSWLFPKLSTLMYTMCQGSCHVVTNRNLYVWHNPGYRTTLPGSITKPCHPVYSAAHRGRVGLNGGLNGLKDCYLYYLQQGTTMVICIRLHVQTHIGSLTSGSSLSVSCPTSMPQLNWQVQLYMSSNFSWVYIVFLFHILP